MKKLAISLLLSVALLTLGVTSNAHAGLFEYEDPLIMGTWSDYYKGYFDEVSEGVDPLWSGYLIGLFDGNTEGEGTNWVVHWAEEYLNETLIDVSYVKQEGPGTTSWLTVTGFKDANEAIGGTWSIASPYEIGFYAVKGGPRWALYYVDPYQSDGFWSTIHLGGNNKQFELSHLSGLASSVDVHLPEPTTMLLLGTGLLGLARLSRKRFFKKD